MKAIILAAGEGHRLSPLTDSTPKVMLPVSNRPILEFVVESIVSAGIRDIVMVVGYHSEKIRLHFGDGRRFGASIQYIVQKKQLGTGHALFQARTESEVMVFPGDNIISGDCVRALMGTHTNTILATYSRNPSKYGAVEHRDGKLIRLTEKPPGRREDVVFTGLGHYDSSIFSAIMEAIEDGQYDMTSALNRMDSVSVLISDCLWKDAIYPWDILDLNAWAMRSLTRSISGKIENSTIIGNVSIGEGTVISGGTYIRGPVVIGKNCYIGPNSVILGDTAIGNDVSIGAMSFVKNSIIMCSTSIGHGSDIEESVVGAASEIGSGVSLLRSKWEKAIYGELISGDAGPVIGDNCRIGPRTIIHGGVRISSGTTVRAENSIREDIHPREEVV